MSNSRFLTAGSAATIAAAVDKIAGTTTKSRFAHQSQVRVDRYASAIDAARDLVVRSQSSMPLIQPSLRHSFHGLRPQQLNFAGTIRIGVGPNDSKLAS